MNKRLASSLAASGSAAVILGVTGAPWPAWAIWAAIIAATAVAHGRRALTA